MVPGAIRSWRPSEVSASLTFMIAHKLVLPCKYLQLTISSDYSIFAIQLCHGNCYLLDWSAIRSYNYPFWGIIMSYWEFIRVELFITILIFSTGLNWFAETPGKNYQLADPFLQHVSSSLFNGLRW
jgi:hypothetical protein